MINAEGRHNWTSGRIMLWTHKHWSVRDGFSIYSTSKVLTQLPWRWETWGNRWFSMLLDCKSQHSSSLAVLANWRSIQCNNVYDCPSLMHVIAAFCTRTMVSTQQSTDSFIHNEIRLWDTRRQSQYNWNAGTHVTIVITPTHKYSLFTH